MLRKRLSKKTEEIVKRTISSVFFRHFFYFYFLPNKTIYSLFLETCYTSALTAKDNKAEQLSDIPASRQLCKLNERVVEHLFQ